MTRRSLLPLVGLCLLFGSLAYSWLLLAPAAPITAYVFNPAYAALLGATVGSVAYAVLVLLKERREHLEKLLLTLFLVGMPVVYVWAALRAQSFSGLLIEGGGIVLFGAWAMFGYRRSTMLLGLGVSVHGIGWDLWRHNHAPYIESWYPLGCFVVDIAFGLAVAAQAYRWRAVALQSTAADPHASAARGYGAGPAEFSRDASKESPW